MDFDLLNSRNLTVPENWDSKLFDQEYEQRPLSGTRGQAQSMPASMSNPRMRAETLNGTRGKAQSMPASMLDPPVRTLLAQGIRNGNSKSDAQGEFQTLRNLLF